MNSFVPLLLALGILLIPWLLMPRGQGELQGAARLIWWLNAAYAAFWHRFEAPEIDPLPSEGPVLLICNHTSGIDHILLQASTRRVLGFLIAKELYDIPVYTPFCKLAGCIPVKRDGRDITATRAALRALKEGRAVPIFPEGHIIPTGGRTLGEGKPGVAYLAVTARVPVIPVYLWGTPENNKFVQSFRMPSHSRILVGPPVDLSEFQHDGKADRDRLEEATAKLMDAIRALRDQVQPPSAEVLSDGQRPLDDPLGLSGGRAPGD